MRFPSAVVSILVLLLFAPGTGAQESSLAELAKKTKKKEKDEKASSETITSQDLRLTGRSGRGNVSPASTTTAAAQPDAEAEGDDVEGGDAGNEGSGEEKTPQELREEARADWRGRLTEAEAAVARLEGRVAELQQSLANPGIGSVEQRARRVADLETAEGELAAARQNVATLQRERRQNGYRR